MYSDRSARVCGCVSHVLIMLMYVMCSPAKCPLVPAPAPPAPPSTRTASPACFSAHAADRAEMPEPHTSTLMRS